MTEDIEELKKQIVLARLRESPPNVKVSFGKDMGGKFLTPKDLIKEINENSKLGKKIIDLQFAYLKALKSIN